MKKKIFYLVYIAVFTGICVLPGILTPFCQDENTVENRKLSEFPEIRTVDGKINTDWTKEFDTYFSEHFAFRNKLVNLNSNLMASVFGTSAEDDVIIGKNGWLYYDYTAGDFIGTSTMKQWEIDNIAHTIEMMEKYAQGYGVQMVFTAVPNKNTIYPEYMPYNYIKNNAPSNLDRLENALSEKNLNYCSLKDTLSEKKNENPDMFLYHKTDTHWNNYGAFTAYSAISDVLGNEQINMDMEYTIEKNWTGDLQKMFFPDSSKKDQQINFNMDNTYTYIGRFRGLDDLTISTVCQEHDGGLLMFRDSFGEAILPFMAESFGTAQFSRTIPYSMNMLETGQYSSVILEIVERNLPNLRKTAPLMPSPECDSIDNLIKSKDSFADCSSIKSGNYLKIYGKLDSEIMGNKSRKIYAVINDKTYEAFPVFEEELLGDSSSGKHGYSLLMNEETADKAEIIIETDNGFVSSGKININKKSNEMDGEK